MAKFNSSNNYLNINNIGFMQGRLVDSPYNSIQCFPSKLWKKEIVIAKKNNLNILEWTINEQNIDKNPLFSSKKLTEILYVKKNNMTINSVTCDYFMQKPFFKIKNNFLRKKILNNLKKIINNCEKINIKYLVIPLVDKSSIENFQQELEIIKFIKNMLKKFKKISILFEIDYPPTQVLRFIKSFKSKRVGINYDIGNSSSLGYAVEKEQIYFKYVKNVHIKDRILNGSTVRLGKGDANIKKTIKILKKKRYNGNFILQTARNKDKKHLYEILLNRNYLFKLNV